MVKMCKWCKKIPANIKKYPYTLCNYCSANQFHMLTMIALSDIEKREKNPEYLEAQIKYHKTKLNYYKNKLKTLLS